MKKVDSSADKTNRIADEIEKLPAGTIITPTQLKNRARVHYTKLKDDMARDKGYRGLNFITKWSSPDKLDFIMKTEPGVLAFKRDIKDIKNDINNIKILLEELKEKKK